MKKKAAIKTDEIKDLATAMGARVRPVAVPKPQPTAQAARLVAKPAGLSLLAKIAKAGKKVDGVAVAEAIGTAKAVLGDQTAITAFVETMEAADALAGQKFGISREKTADEWYAMSMPAVRNQLSSWSNGGDTLAGQLLDTLDTFGESKVDVVGPLWDLYINMVRPANRVHSYYDLSQVLHDLVKKNLAAIRYEKPDYIWPPEAVLLQNGTEGFKFTRGNQMAEVAWPWVKKAEARAQESAEIRRQKFEQMKLESNSEPVTPKEAKKGLEGKVFIVIDEAMNRGVLVHIKSNSDGPCVRVISAVGMPIRPGIWIRWDAEPVCWPNGDLYHAFQAWKQKR